MSGRSGRNFVRSFFQSRELNNRKSLKIGTEQGLWSFLLDDAAIRGATKAAPLVFRGQADEHYGVSSSLYRFVRAETNDPITERLLYDIEETILKSARHKGLGKGIEDGQLLMLLQHYGFPTRLIDVSTGALEALYFATEHLDATDGRLFVFRIVERTGWRYALDLDGPLPWNRQADVGWTETVSLVEPLPLDPRMGAQGSKFLVGGSIKASADRNIHFEGHNNFLDKDELPQITTLSIGFHQQAPAIERTAWHALGWSIRIPAEWKAGLRRRLAEAGISRESMYPPFATVQWETTAAARDKIGFLTR